MRIYRKIVALSSIPYFRQAILKGILEKTYCHNILAQIDSSYENPVADQKKIQDSNIFLFRLGKKCHFLKNKIEATHFEKSPAFLENYRTFLQKTNYQGIDILKHLKKSSTYQQYLPFWEIRQSKNMSGPILKEAPPAARQAWCYKKEPYFNTLYIQRIMMPEFRAELWHASLGNMKLSQNSISKGIDINLLAEISNEMNEFLNVLTHTSSSMSKLEISLAARVIGNLGFTQKAIELSEFDYTTNKWDVDDTYLVNTHICIFRLIRSVVPPKAITFPLSFRCLFR